MKFFVLVGDHNPTTHKKLDSKKKNDEGQFKLIFIAPVKVRNLFIRCISGLFGLELGLFDVFTRPGSKVSALD